MSHIADNRRGDIIMALWRAQVSASPPQRASGQHPAGAGSTAARAARAVAPCGIAESDSRTVRAGVVTFAMGAAPRPSSAAARRGQWSQDPSFSVLPVSYVLDPFRLHYFCVFKKKKSTRKTRKKYRILDEGGEKGKSGLGCNLCLASRLPALKPQQVKAFFSAQNCVAQQARRSARQRRLAQQARPPRPSFKSFAQQAVFTA